MYDCFVKDSLAEKIQISQNSDFKYDALFCGVSYTPQSEPVGRGLALMNQSAILNIAHVQSASKINNEHK